MYRTQYNQATSCLSAAVHLLVAVTADAYLALRSDNPSQLFIPGESFRYVTWPPLARASSHADLVSRALPETQGGCQPRPQQVTLGLFVFKCVAPLNKKKTTGCFRRSRLWHQVTKYNLQIHRFLKAPLRHLGPTWDCYLEQHGQSGHVVPFPLGELSQGQERSAGAGATTSER